MSSDFEETEVLVLKNTDKALLCDFGLENPVWVPFGVITPESGVEALEQVGTGRMVELAVADWFLVKEGIV